MEYSFPPPPPDATMVITARWMLVIWSLIGFGIVLVRLRNWKAVRPKEMRYWLIAAGLSVVVGVFGISPHEPWDDSFGILLGIVSALMVSIVGIAVCLWKLYDDGFWIESDIRRTDFVIVLCIAAPIVLSLITPAVNSQRPSRQLECMNNERQFGIAMLSVAQNAQGFLPSRQGEGPASWRVMLLPQLDWMSVYSKYDQSLPWDRPPNDEFSRVWNIVASCPSNYYRQDGQGRWFTAFSMPTGPHSIGDSSTGTHFSDVTDGMSSTLLFVEAAGAQIVWTEPRDVDIDRQPTGINLNGDKPGHSAGWLSSYHRGGVNVIMADGSARRLSNKTDPVLLKKLATIDGGETIKPGEFP